MFYPKEEGHHSDCSGKGPADTFIVRGGHQIIHQDNAYWAKIMSGREPEDSGFKGFCGDPFTLKLGNKFYDEEENEGYELDLSKFSPSMFIYKKEISYKYKTWEFLDKDSVLPFSSLPSTIPYSSNSYSNLPSNGLLPSVDRAQFCTLNPGYDPGY